VTRYVTFEHPLNERTRTFLRLEHLFKQVEFFVSQESGWAARASISALLDILGATGRSDIKSEILKELERTSTALARIRRQQGVDLKMLDQVLGELEQTSLRVYQMEGQIGQQLRENEFLKSIAQRSSIPGGTCSFDLPQLHLWLEQGADRRQHNLKGWVQTLEPIREAIALLLSLTRGSSTARQVTAPQGFFQDSLDAQVPHQMIRIGLSQDIPWYPEVSGHKHRFTIRFLDGTSSERPVQTQEDVEFLLTCCVI
jgi:cell division protein ZapD